MEKITNQHGDLLFIKVTEIPKQAKQVKNVKKGFVLERGEGIHTHVLDEIEGVKIYEKDGDTYVKVDQPVKINHEEHGIQILKTGVYKKQIERVWAYEKEESRRVLD